MNPARVGLRVGNTSAGCSGTTIGGPRDLGWISVRCEVKLAIGRFAAPEAVYVAPGLPKTRSRKIMRRILRKIAAGEYEGMGHITTLAEAEVVEKLITQHRHRAAAR
jgi:acetyl-CoA synthetase